MSVVRPTAGEWRLLGELAARGAVDMTLVVGNMASERVAGGVALHEFWKFQTIDRSGERVKMVEHSARSLADLHAKVFPPPEAR
jgi:hypothetical protein